MPSWRITKPSLEKNEISIVWPSWVVVTIVQPAHQCGTKDSGSQQRGMATELFTISRTGQQIYACNRTVKQAYRPQQIPQAMKFFEAGGCTP